MMRETKRMLLVTMTIIIIIASFAMNVFAETAYMIDVSIPVPSAPIGQPEVDIRTVIEQTATDAKVQSYYEGMQSNTPELPEQPIFDREKYLLVYPVFTDYWNKVSEMSYEGMTEVISGSYPSIIIPLYGKIESTSGTVFDRVVGHMKLSYNPLSKEYGFHMAIYNLGSKAYRDMELFPFYEKILAYLNRNNVVAQQVLMIEYPSSLTMGQEQIVLVKTAEDTVILDISNSARADTDPTTKLNLQEYSISDYRALRLEAEKEIYKEVDSWREVVFGGSGALNRIEKVIDQYWMLFCVAAILPIGAVSFVVIRRFRRR